MTSLPTLIVILAHGGDYEEQDSLCLVLKPDVSPDLICEFKSNRMYLNQDPFWQAFYDAVPRVSETHDIEEIARTLYAEHAGEDFDEDDDDLSKLVRLLGAVDTVYQARGFMTTQQYAEVIVMFLYD